MKLFHALGVSLFAFPFLLVEFAVPLFALALLLVEALAPPIQEPGYPDEKDDVDDEADGDEGHHEEAHPAAGGGEQVDGYWWANEGLHDGTSVAAASGFGCFRLREQVRMPVVFGRRSEGLSNCLADELGDGAGLEVGQALELAVDRGRHVDRAPYGVDLLPGHGGLLLERYASITLKEGQGPVNVEALVCRGAVAFGHRVVAGFV